MRICRYVVSSIAVLLLGCPALAQSGVAVYVVRGALHQLDLASGVDTIVDYLGVSTSDLEINKTEDTAYMIADTDLRALDLATGELTKVAEGFDHAVALDLLPTAGNNAETTAFVLDANGLWQVNLMAVDDVALETSLLTAPVSFNGDIEVSPDGNRIYAVTELDIWRWHRHPQSTLEQIPYNSARGTSVVVDPSESFVYVMENDDGIDIHAYDTINQVWAQLPGHPGTSALKHAISPDGNRLYLAPFAPRRFGVYDLQTLVFGDVPIPTEFYASGIAASTPSDAHVYFGGSRLSRVELATQTFEPVGPQVVYSLHSSIVLRAGTGQAYVWGRDPLSVRLVELDVGGGVVSSVATSLTSSVLSPPNNPIAAPRGETFVYTTNAGNLVRIDSDGTESIEIAGWSGAAGLQELAIDAAGVRLFSADYIELAMTELTTGVITPLPTSKSVSSIAPTSDGATVYIVFGGPTADLVRYDVATQSETLVCVLPGPSERIELGEDGAAAYVQLQGGSLMRVDLEVPGPTPTLVGRIDHADFMILNTGPGQYVSAQPIDATTGGQPVTLTFENVTQGGESSVTTSTTGPAVPSGFQIGDPATYYEISTSAAFEGTVEVCIDYSGVTYTDEASLQLLHHVNGSWEIVPATLDMATDTICGFVTSFSPFAVVEFPAPTMVADLIAKIHGFDFHHGLQTSLDAKLGAAQQGLAEVRLGNHPATINHLQAFINHAQAQSGNQIPAAVAAELIADAQAIIAAL